MLTRTWCNGLVILSLGTSCIEPPLDSTPASGGSGSGGSPTSFDPPVTTSSTGEPTTGPTSTSTGTPTTSSTGEPDRPVCGDGVVDDPEECDLGGANANAGACTLECKLAVCGDGLVHAGVEECDFGLGNDESYNGCRPESCQLGPRCGDGILDAEFELCDRGPLNGTGVTNDEFAPCSLMCGFQGRILFMTSESFTGDLGGVSGGDLKCRSAALAAGLPNASEYRAWLSDDFQSPATRFDQWDFPDVPIILVGGLVVADDLLDLVDNGPRRGISRDEFGDSSFLQRVWTNTSAFGESFSVTNHCAAWTSASELLAARQGRNAPAVEEGPEWQIWLEERWWTSHIGRPCNGLAHLYCIDDGFVLEQER